MRNLVRQYRGLPRPVYILFVSKIVDATGCFVFPLLTLIMTDKMGMTGGQAGLVTGGIAVLAIPALMVGGKLADAIGRKPAILLSVGTTVVAYGACGFLPPSPLMLALVVAGITGLNAAGVAQDALVADLAPPEKRQAAYGLLYLGWNIGFAAGPAIGGFLLDRHLGVMFIGDAATALAALVMVMLFVPETRRRKTAPADGGQTSAADAPAGLETAERGSIVGVIIRRPVLFVLSVVLFGYSFAYVQWNFLLPIDLSRSFGGDGAKVFGFIAALNGLTVIVFNPILTLLFRKSPHPRTMLIGGLLYAAGFGLFAFARSVPVFFFLGFVFTLGEIANAISTMPFIMAMTPASHRGRMSGAMQGMMTTGAAVGPIAVGAALAGVSVRAAWVVIGAVALLASLPMIALWRAGVRAARRTTAAP